MEPGSEVRLRVAQCFRTLSSSTDHGDIIDALKTLNSYVNDGAESRTTSAEREEFRRSHYSRTLRVLVGQLQADWMHSLSAAQLSQVWDPLFLKGPPDQALLVLMEAVSELSPSTGLDRLVCITERFLQSGHLADLLWSFCLQPAPSGSPQLRETLLARLTSLPDITANKLHPNNRALFVPQRYYPLLASEMLAALERTCQALRGYSDGMFVEVYSCMCLVLAVMAPRLAVCTRSDMVWQRVCWKLLENVPERWMESVLTGLVQAVKSPDAFSRIVGNLVLTNKKAHFVLTHKVLLLQYKYELDRCVLSGCAVGVAGLGQPQRSETHPSGAAALRQQNLTADYLLQCMLGGMQSHLDSSVVRIRTMGMVVGECLSSRMEINGTKLKFEYKQNEETRELLSLMTPSMCTEPEPEPADGADFAEETREPSTHRSTSQSRPASQRSKSDPDSDLDSDDDLTPYDMSGDQEMSRASPPRYLRDCLETLISSEDSERVELSLRVAESLVRRNVFAAKEISVQMTKVLLHMEDKYSIDGFLALRQAAMVALTVIDSVPVTQHLTTEFYSLNYSLRQRLDILEVLALAAQELSKPASDKTTPSTSTTSELTSYQTNNPADWRQVVDKRIQSKTKLISKGPTQPVTKAAPNRYAPVAGYFFFPLLRNYDKPEVTFDLLGSDQLVLGRLIHTLGLFMHLAVNAPIAAQMGAALLDFLWAVRYHAD
ncbi:hypothetical protein GOODEAATRI_002851, partial [Goodea atripinnis]